jgi:hypothetical protein
MLKAKKMNECGKQKKKINAEMGCNKEISYGDDTPHSNNDADIFITSLIHAAMCSNFQEKILC